MALTGWVRPRHAPGATAAWLMAPSVSGSQVEAHGFGMVCCMGRTCRAPGAPSHTEVWHGKEARRFLRRTRDCHRRICTPLSPRGLVPRRTHWATTAADESEILRDGGVPRYPAPMLHMSAISNRLPTVLT